MYWVRRLLKSLALLLVGLAILALAFGVLYAAVVGALCAAYIGGHARGYWLGIKHPVTKEAP